MKKYLRVVPIEEFAKRKDSWVEECLRYYSWKDLKGTYEVNERIVRKNIKGEKLKVEFASYGYYRFNRVQADVIMDRNKKMWIEENKYFEIVYTR